MDLDLHPKHRGNADSRSPMVQKDSVSRSTAIWVRNWRGFPDQRRHVRSHSTQQKTDAAMMPDDNEESYRFLRKFSAQPQTMKHSFHQGAFRRNPTVGSQIIGAYHLAFSVSNCPACAACKDYRLHVDRATPGGPCRSATPSPEVVRSICLKVFIISAMVGKTSSSIASGFLCRHTR